MTVTRMIARPMLASVFFVGAASALKNSDKAAAKAKPVTDKLTPLLQKAAPGGVSIPTDPQTLVRLNAATQIAAAAALATGRAPRLASTVLAASLVPTTIGGHRFWEESDPQTKQAQRLHFFKNISMLGGVLLAAVDTDGKPGVAWRAGNLASGVGKDARRLRRTAAREAKLAAKSIGS